MKATRAPQKPTIRLSPGGLELLRYVATHQVQWHSNRPAPIGPLDAQGLVEVYRRDGLNAVRLSRTGRRYVTRTGLATRLVNTCQ